MGWHPAYHDVNITSFVKHDQQIVCNSEPYLDCVWEHNNCLFHLETYLECASETFFYEQLLLQLLDLLDLITTTKKVECALFLFMDIRDIDCE